MEGTPRLYATLVQVLRQHQRKHGYTLTDIGKVVGLHYTTVSRIMNRK
jgi:DNA-binding MarR family transcriptional regulator